MVAGAVILGDSIDGLKDSKLLSAKQRELLAKQIKQKAVSYHLGWVEPAEIDKIGLSLANRLAVERALEGISNEYDQIIIDGNINYLDNNPKAKAIIKADKNVPAVSAASIIAKVARDQYMQDMDSEYPGYYFGKHVGYGTALHLQSLKTLGVSPIHRLSYKPVAKVALG